MMPLMPDDTIINERAMSRAFIIYVSRLPFSTPLIKGSHHADAAMLYAAISLFD